MAGPGEFTPTHPEIHCREGFSRKCVSEGYDIVTDTNGKLLSVIQYEDEGVWLRYAVEK